MPVGWFFFLGTLIPVIGLVQVGTHAFADRYTYIPYIGLFIMVAWGAAEILSHLQDGKFISGISMAIIIAAFGICTYYQLGYWQNNITLFSHAVEVTENNYLVHCNLGKELRVRAKHSLR